MIWRQDGNSYTASAETAGGRVLSVAAWCSNGFADGKGLDGLEIRANQSWPAIAPLRRSGGGGGGRR
jgi:hypothetical protein